MTAIAIEAEMPQTISLDAVSMFTMNQAQKVSIEIIDDPKAAAFCPLGEYPPLIPCSHGCKVVMSLTLSLIHI